MALAVAMPVQTATPQPVTGRVAPDPGAGVKGPLTEVPAIPGTLSAPKSERLRAAVTRPYNNRPDRLNGKVFFTKDGVDYLCSGTVVNSANKDMVDTAGHCVSDGAGNFVTNWVFVPGFGSNPSGGNAGTYPYGIWTARELTTTEQWHHHGNIKQDLGYGVVAPLGGQDIATYLGGHGSSFNASRSQVFNAFGYPQAFPYNGRDQRVSVSRRYGDDAAVNGSPGPSPIRIKSDLTGGASGGGWITNISSSTGLGKVNGHNSYRYVGGSPANADRMYGPYYGSEALALFNFTQVL